MSCLPAPPRLRNRGRLPAFVRVGRRRTSVESWPVSYHTGPPSRRRPSKPAAHPAKRVTTDVQAPGPPGACRGVAALVPPLIRVVVDHCRLAPRPAGRRLGRGSAAPLLPLPQVVRQYNVPWPAAPDPRGVDGLHFARNDPGTHPVGADTQQPCQLSGGIALVVVGTGWQWPPCLRFCSHDGPAYRGRLPACGLGWAIVR